MSLLRNHLNAIAKRSGCIITVINLVGAFSSTTALLLVTPPNSPIITTSGGNISIPALIEKDDKRQANTCK